MSGQSFEFWVVAHLQSILRTLRVHLGRERWELSDIFEGAMATDTGLLSKLVRGLVAGKTITLEVGCELCSRNGCRSAV